MPALVVILVQQEREKGSPLTQEEVLSIRDKSVCVMLPLPEAGKMAEQRGYDDIDPEDVWAEWLKVRATISDHLTE